MYCAADERLLPENIAPPKANKVRLRRGESHGERGWQSSTVQYRHRKKHLQNFDILIEKHGEALKHPPRSTHGDSAEGHLRFLGDRLLSLLSGTEGAFVAHPAVLAVPVGSAQLAAVRHVLAVHGLAVESAPCSQAPKVNVLPIIATKGGRGGKGKVIACPIYKRMNTLTAYELSARAREGCSGRLDRVPLALSELSCTFRVALSESLAFAVHLTCICALLHSRQDTWGNFSLAQLSGRRTRYSPRAASLLGRLGSGAQAHLTQRVTGSTLQGALYREHFTGSTLQGARCCNCSYRRILYD